MRYFRTPYAAMSVLACSLLGACQSQMAPHGSFPRLASEGEPSENPEANGGFDGLPAGTPRESDARPESPAKASEDEETETGLIPSLYDAGDAEEVSPMVSGSVPPPSTASETMVASEDGAADEDTESGGLPSLLDAAREIVPLPFAALPPSVPAAALPPVTAAGDDAPAISDPEDDSESGGLVSLLDAAEEAPLVAPSPPSPKDENSAIAPKGGTAFALKPLAPAPAEYRLEIGNGKELRIRGIDVFVVEGEKETPAPDGVYVAKDGKIIPTRNGRVRGLE